jgi:hypothetical protein
MGEVSLQWPEGRPPEEALSRVLADQHGTIEANGYREGRRTRNSVSFRRRRRFIPRSEQFTILATEGENGGSVLVVEGAMRRRLRSTFAGIAEAHRSNGAAPVSRGADQRVSSNGSAPRAWSAMEQELRRIYELVGKPSAFGEAKGKVEVLADCLCRERRIDHDEALRLAYDRSLAEHREYLASKRISH